MVAPSCEQTLALCVDYTKALEHEVTLRRGEALKENEKPRGYPWYYWLVLGAAIGYSGALTLKEVK